MQCFNGMRKAFSTSQLAQSKENYILFYVDAQTMASVHYVSCVAGAAKAFYK